MYNIQTASTDGKRNERTVLKDIVAAAAKAGVKRFGSVALSFRCDGEKAIRRAAEALRIESFGYCVEGKDAGVYADMARLCPPAYHPVWGNIIDVQNILSKVKPAHLSNLFLIWLDFCGAAYSTINGFQTLKSIGEWIKAIPINVKFDPCILTTFSLNPQGISKSRVYNELLNLLPTAKRDKVMQEKLPLEKLLTIAIMVSVQEALKGTQFGAALKFVHLYKGGVKSNMVMVGLQRTNDRLFHLRCFEYNDNRPDDYKDATTFSTIFSRKPYVVHHAADNPIMVAAGKKAWETRRANAQKKMLQAA